MLDSGHRIPRHPLLCFAPRRRNTAPDAVATAAVKEEEDGASLAPDVALAVKHPAPDALSVTDASTDAALDRALAGAQRSSANRDRDVYRHPKATLEFFGIEDTMTVLRETGFG